MILASRALKGLTHASANPSLRSAATCTSSLLRNPHRKKKNYRHRCSQIHTDELHFISVKIGASSVAKILSFSEKPRRAFAHSPRCWPAGGNRGLWTAWLTRELLS